MRGRWLRRDPQHWLREVIAGRPVETRDKWRREPEAGDSAVGAPGGGILRAIAREPVSLRERGTLPRRAHPPCDSGQSHSSADCRSLKNRRRMPRFSAKVSMYLARELIGRPATT